VRVLLGSTILLGEEAVRATVHSAVEGVSSKDVRDPLVEEGVSNLDGVKLRSGRTAMGTTSSDERTNVGVLVNVVKLSSHEIGPLFLATTHLVERGLDEVIVRGIGGVTVLREVVGHIHEDLTDNRLGVVAGVLLVKRRNERGKGEVPVIPGTSPLGRRHDTNLTVSPDGMLGIRVASHDESRVHKDSQTSSRAADLDNGLGIRNLALDEGKSISNVHTTLVLNLVRSIVSGVVTSVDISGTVRDVQDVVSSGRGARVSGRKDTVRTIEAGELTVDGNRLAVDGEEARTSVPASTTA